MLIVVLLLSALMAWPAEAAQLSLTWMDNSNNEDGFRVERKTGTGGTYAQIGTVGPNVASYVDSGLAVGTTYCYRVLAFNTSGNSAYSNEACSTAPQTFSLAVVRAGTGNGTVTSAPAGITCGTSCSGSYASGTAVTLTATPATGSAFTGWSGGGCSGTGSCTLTLTATTTVMATFATAATPTYTLTVAKAGTGNGTVTSTPAGITCGTTCSASYASGTSVTLSASPASGSTFTGWSGGGCSGTSSCTLTLTATTSVTATFGTSTPTAASQPQPNSPIASFVSGFYVEVLGRSPDPGGLASWTDYLRANCNAGGFSTVAQSFFDSQEFRTVRPLSLTDLVRVQYRSVLGREPDSGGLAGWADVFRQARLTMALQGFIPSREFQSLLPDRKNRDAVTAVVTRLYTQILGRAPEPAGLTAWVDFIVSTGNLEGAAVGFLTSQEFESHALTSRDYVTILYRTFLGRDPEPAGLDAWEAVLRATLLQVLNTGFIPSPEFQGLSTVLCR